MDSARARMIFSHPPYNVPIAGHVSGLGNVQHCEFAMASGEMSKEEFTAFLATACSNLATAPVDGAIAFICMDWRHMEEMGAVGQVAFTEFKNPIVWVKDNGGMSSFYRSKHEFVFAYKIGTAPRINSFEPGQHGRYRANVWTYKGMNSFGAGRDEALALHPTVKPVAMIADAISDEASAIRPHDVLLRLCLDGAGSRRTNGLDRLLRLHAEFDQHQGDDGAGPSKPTLAVATPHVRHVAGVLAQACSRHFRMSPTSVSTWGWHQAPMTWPISRSRRFKSCVGLRASSCRQHKR